MGDVYVRYARYMKFGPGQYASFCTMLYMACSTYYIVSKNRYDVYVYIYIYIYDIYIIYCVVSFKKAEVGAIPVSLKRVEVGAIPIS